jgi:hypothetical protein
MDKNNNRKAQLLGVSHGTASNKLRKNLLFKYVKLAQEDTCYRCNQKIENVDEFSIEHKTGWQRSSSPVETFFDLDNISFSHLKCNVRSAKRHIPPIKEHGSSAYKNRGCRCEYCKWLKSTSDPRRPTAKNPTKDRGRHAPLAED